MQALCILFLNFSVGHVHVKLFKGMDTGLETVDNTSSDSAYVTTRDQLLDRIAAKKTAIITGKVALSGDILPRRGDFVEPELAQALRQRIERAAPNDAGAIFFCPLTVVEKDDYRCAFTGGSQNAATRFYLFGVLPCGSKACAVLTNIPVYCYVRCVDDKGIKVQPQAFIQRMKTIIGVTPRCKATKFGIERLLPAKEFAKAPVEYCRIDFDNRISRKSALEAIQSAGYQTASDDVGSDGYYFNMMAREFKFATAGWNRVTNYRPLAPQCNLSTIFEVDIREFRALTPEKKAAIGGKLAEAIARDRILEAQWDIETRSREEYGALPTPGSAYNIICINTWYTWYSAEESVLSVAVTDMVTVPDDRQGLVVVCDSEQEVLAVHFKIMGTMAPDLLSAFNGSGFDWPLVRDKAARYRMLTEMQRTLSSMPLPPSADEQSAYKWAFTTKKVKLEADNNHTCPVVLNVAGILDIDSQPMFMKMNSKAEVTKQKSLNFFLATAGLQSKEDMHFNRMFKVWDRANALKPIKSCHCAVRADCAVCCTHVREIDYEYSGSISEPAYSTTLFPDVATTCCHCSKLPRNRQDVADVLYYCTVDCKRPHQLFIKTALLDDKRALACMAYTTLTDAFYRADGQKVNNLIGRYCAENGYAYSSKSVKRHDHEKEHYPGAWVFPPNKGLHSDGIVKVMVLENPDKIGQHRFILVDRQGRPIVGLDFASLYPSLMMTYDFSTDRIVKTAGEAAALMAEGYVLRPIEFDYEVGKDKGSAGNRHYTARGWSVRHNNVMKPGDRRSRYAWHDATGAEITEPISHEDAVAAGAQLRPVDAGESLPGESMGIFPSVVKELFDRRVPVKAEFGCYIKHKEIIKKSGADTINVKLPSGAVHKMKLQDIEFMANKVNANQKALKTLSNTFYGASGDNRNSIYELLVAGGVTSAGQYNIKMVAKFVSDSGFGIHYGDTDSLYISPPDNVFRDEDLAYIVAVSEICSRANVRPPRVIPGVTFGQPSDLWTVETHAEDMAGLPADSRAALQSELDEARRIWWEAMVAITMKSVTELNKRVTEMLILDNGTGFLKMAYEEVCYPTLLCGKKKYCAIAHMDTINFKVEPEDIFIRGIEFTKRGQAKKSRELGYGIISELLSYKNYRGPLSIVEETLRRFHAKYHGRTLEPEEVALFSMFAQYKPDKKNVSVHRFVARMKELYDSMTSKDRLAAESYTPPEAGDKFEYVIAARPAEFTQEGRIVKMNKGDFMEYTHIYFKDKHDLDIDWYVRNQFIGTMARFACSDNRFLPNTIPNLLDKDLYKTFDKACVDAASDYITRQYDAMVGFDKRATAVAGQHNRKVYKEIKKAIDRGVRELSSDAADALTRVQSENAPGTSGLLSKFAAVAETNCPEALVTMLAKKRVDLVERRGHLQKSVLIDQVIVAKIKKYAAREKAAGNQINALSNEVWDILSARDARLKTAITKLREGMSEDAIDEYADVINGFSDKELETLEQLNRLGIEFVVAFGCRRKEKAYLDELKMRRIVRLDAKPSADVLSAETTADFRNGFGIRDLPVYNW